MKKNTEVKRNRLIYLVTGVALLIFGIYLNIGYLNRGEFPHAIIFIALAINQLAWAYVAPHIFPKDERSKTIREKAMTINYYMVLIVIIVLLYVSEQMNLTAYQALTIVGCFSLLSTAFAMIFFSKRV
ncbi:hypothetical protein FQV26_14190 [Planococcus sp. CPCC 101016]|uniref:hypothetical protein n=1 Tax=Planococcus sp. CPCC 101016 TaxID=2599617 RepID=UPI0011B6B457|nr:hypothetical protein [Planococcus sp. CPCC 101016]TWT05574.1 hypothetical protein FQV26_14190 [Planococcus sp. CPCC 101016]